MYRTKLFFVCGACLVWTNTRFAFALPFDESKGYMHYALSKPATLKKTVVPAARELTVDDAIVALSKASGINFVADATQIPANTFVAPFPATPIARANKWTPSFYAVTEDLCEAAQLSNLRYDDSTFLLWKRPSVIETADALVAAGKLRPQSPLPNQLDLFHALDDFSRNSTEWKTLGLESAPRTSEDTTFRLGDVPLPIREQLLALLRANILRPDWQRELILSDAFWKTARVSVVPSAPAPITRKVVPLVYISGQDDKGGALPVLRFDRRLGNLDRINGNSVGFPTPLDDQTKTPLVTANGGIPLPTALVTDGLTPAELEAQENLKSPVSLEAKRQPLRDLLSAVSQQGGVPLSLAPGVPNPLVTLHVQSMPLSELMSALGRLSDGKWRKNTVGYDLQAHPLEEWQKLLHQSGEGDFEGYGIEAQFTPEELQPLRDIEQAVADELGEQKMAEQGVPFSVLSGDLQEQIKQTMRSAAADSIVRAYNDAFVFAAPEGTVRMWHSPATGDWNIRLLDASNYMTLAATVVRQPPQPKKERPNGAGFQAPDPDAP